MPERWRTIPGFVCVGHTGKTRGRDGEIKFFPESHYLDDILQAEFLFIEIDGNKVPLRLASVREVGDILLKFDSIDDPGAAARWASTAVYLPSDEVQASATRDTSLDLTYHALQGYVLHDTQLGDLGSIIEVREFPQQEMAVISHHGREVLVPLNPVFIIDIDETTHTVHMDLPDGLLEV